MIFSSNSVTDKRDTVSADDECTVCVLLFPPGNIMLWGALCATGLVVISMLQYVLDVRGESAAC